MFEILGYIKGSEERFLRYVDRRVDDFVDFTDRKFSDVCNKTVILPPDKSAVSHYIKENTVIICTENPFLPGILSLKDFEKTLFSLAEFKNIFFELNLYCTDFDFATRKKNTLSINRGILNSYVNQSRVFENERFGVSYYTYNGHLVFVNDVKSVSLRHNLIKRCGFKGVFVRDVNMASDGNWDSLCGMKKAQNS